MASAEEIRNRLADLLDRKISLDDFQDWFEPYVWNIHKRADRETQDLAYQIGLKLAEYSSGDLEKSLLIKELAVASRPFVCNIDRIPARRASLNTGVLPIPNIRSDVSAPWGLVAASVAIAVALPLMVEVKASAANSLPLSIAPPHLEVQTPL